jgi:endothelin-converting enzyme
MKVSINIQPSRSNPTYHSVSHSESAPLLQDIPGNGGPHHPPTSSIADKLGSILQDPLTALNKILLILLLLLLLLSSIFIGLFVGSQHKLHNEPDAPGGKHPPSTLTTTVTIPLTATAIVTTTAVTTVTAAPPPGPSNPPGEAGLPFFW